MNILSQLPNALYYFFSTTSQAIATALGLIAAFAIFKISRLGEIIDDCTSFISQRSGDNESSKKIFDAIHDENYEEVLNVWKGLTKNPPGGEWSAYHMLYIKRLFFERKLNEVKDIRSKLAYAFTISVIVIIASLIIISLIPFFNQRPILSYFIFTAGVISSIVSIVSLWKLIESTVKTFQKE